MAEQLYKTVYVYKKSGRKVTVDTHLTLKEAQDIVQKDIDSGASTKVKMLVFYKM